MPKKPRLSKRGKAIIIGRLRKKRAIIAKIRELFPEASPRRVKSIASAIYRSRKSKRLSPILQQFWARYEGISERETPASQVRRELEQDKITFGKKEVTLKSGKIEERPIRRTFKTTRKPGGERYMLVTLCEDYAEYPEPFLDYTFHRQLPTHPNPPLEQATLTHNEIKPGHTILNTIELIKILEGE